MAWRLDTTVDGRPAWAAWDDSVLVAEPEKWQAAALRLLEGELFPTPTSAPETDPAGRAALAICEAAAEVWGLTWQTAPKAWSGESPADAAPAPPGTVQ